MDNNVLYIFGKKTRNEKLNDCIRNKKKKKLRVMNTKIVEITLKV